MENEPLKVGDVLYQRNGEPVEVTKVGRKYFELNHGKYPHRRKYDIASLGSKRVKSSDCSDFYRTKEDADYQITRRELTDKVKGVINWWYAEQLTNEQLEILVEMFKNLKKW